MASVIKPTDIPTPPHAALRVIQACADDKVDANRLSGLIGGDPVLTAELLRVVNSAFYSLGREVRSIAQAVTIIGQRALRNLVLCISVRDTLRDQASQNMDMADFMDDMLRRAVCARILGEENGLDAQECFTAGILQDFGILVMFKQQPDSNASWNDFRHADPDARYVLEQEAFGTTHDQVGLMVARSWGLPDDLTTVMAYHHHTENGDDIDSDMRPLCKVAECADWMASTFTARNTTSVITTCREKLRAHFDIDSGQAESLLLRSSDAVNEAASAMGVALKENISFESVMQDANRKLAEENLSYQDLVWRLEQTIIERDQLAAELQGDLELAREIQQGLLPKQTNHDFPICAINLSAREVSGDFFDFFTLPDGKIYFNIADVSGKGMNAALLMAKTSSLFRCLGKAIHSPAKLLAMINTELVETSIRGRFVTLVAGVYDPKTRKAIVVNAGHLPIVHLKKNAEHVFIPALDSPLGISDGIIFKETTIELGTGKLVMYTDGVSECYNRGRTTLTDKALLQLFDQLTQTNACDMESELLKILKLQKDTLTDDLSILVIR